MAKFRIRKTGEIVDVISYSGSTKRNDVLDYVSYIDSNGAECPNVSGMNLFWDFEKIDNNLNGNKINWEERRYEIAKAALPEALNVFKDVDVDPVERSVHYADNLIKLLKNEAIRTEDSNTLSDSEFWQDLYNKMSNDPKWIRIDGNSYIFASIDDKCPKGWNIFKYSKAIGYAKLKNGNAIHSGNIWYQGKVPEEFKELMPDNAEWISKDEFDNAKIVGYSLGCGIVFTDRVNLEG